MAGDFNSLLSLAGIGADPKGGHALLPREMAATCALIQLGRRPTVSKPSQPSPALASHVRHAL